MGERAAGAATRPPHCLSIGTRCATELTLRLEHAEVWLRDPRLPISRVAREVGYATPHRFRVAFRSWAGLSPGRWRAAWRVEDAG